MAPMAAERVRRVGVLITGMVKISPPRRRQRRCAKAQGTWAGWKAAICGSNSLSRAIPKRSLPAPRSWSLRLPIAFRIALKLDETVAMKFLVVDDHELIREAMRGALAELDGDATILEASDSGETMRLIEEHPDVDLILLDLNLPDRDGLTVLSELRKSHPAISVVVMSARQDRDSVVKALNQGALGFIPKSVTRKVILGAVQLVISGGVYIPPQALAGQEQARRAANI